MRHILKFAGGLIIGAVFFAPALGVESAMADDAKQVVTDREDYRRVPMPPGFRVESSELEGPVFANSRGMTLYFWPQDTMRNGITGDPKNQSMCTDVPTTVTGGLMSPYPPGLALPELDKRKSCAEVWPPELASDEDKPIGSFTAVALKDGRKQWAYDGHVLYTSVLDEMPGDVRGATNRRVSGEPPAPRKVATVPPAIPPGFGITSMAMGRMLVTDKNFSVYMSDRDGVRKSNCYGACARTWDPMLAPISATPQGAWSVFERSPGILQWALRGKPLYTNVLDADIRSQQGSDAPGWDNVFTQKAPPPPKEFTMQDTEVGIVLADTNGKTIYLYNCGDDSFDQLACNHPNSPQVYRLAICGGGNVGRCLREWPYVSATPDAKSTNRTWTVIEIDPQTGHFAKSGQEGTLRVWAHRGAPVYTHARDKMPGDIIGNANGEFGGGRNGFQAFFLRDDFFNNAG